MVIYCTRTSLSRSVVLYFEDGVCILRFKLVQQTLSTSNFKA